LTTKAYVEAQEPLREHLLEHLRRAGLASMTG
jgi:hypothetical protein